MTRRNHYCRNTEIGEDTLPTASDAIAIAVRGSPLKGFLAGMILMVIFGWFIPLFLGGIVESSSNPYIKMLSGAADVVIGLFRIVGFGGGVACWLIAGFKVLFTRSNNQPSIARDRVFGENEQHPSPSRFPPKTHVNVADQTAERDIECDGCPAIISTSVAAYCLSNRGRLGGRKLCMSCQQKFK